MTDQQLLREYSERRAEGAFGELVQRHVDMVYSAALRMVRDAHLAEDVTQGVFVALAQSAGQLTDRPVVSGWLHRTTQNIAANAVRTDVRRRAREQEALAMKDLLAAESDAVWEEITPHLDAALGEMSEPDRDALLLRYFERKSAREMALTLGTSEEAAQKRVSRAVERLRELLAKRGVTAGASGLAVLLGANAVQAAPAGLAAASYTAALLGGTAVATLTTATVAKTFAMTTLQKTLVATTLAVAIGVGGYSTWQTARARAEVKRLEQQQRQTSPEAAPEALRVSLQAKVEKLEAQNAELTRALAQANTEKVRLENERQQARHSAALFKELADHASAQGQSSTNEFPTRRHLMAGWGRFGRLTVQLKKDESQLSEEEKAALATAKVKAIEEMARLVKASKELDLKKLEDAPEEEKWDAVACVLHGALDLDEQQFGTMRMLVQKYGQEFKQMESPSENATPKAEGAKKEMIEKALAEIQSILNPEQAEVFTQFLPNFKFGTNNWNFGFNF